MKEYMVLLFFLVTCALMVSGCRMHIKDPNIEIKSVTLGSVNLSQISLLVTLDIDNPNPVGINLKSINFDIYYQMGSEWIFISHVEQGNLRIKPGLNEVTIPVTIKTSALPAAVVGALTKGEITLQIKGNASPDFFGITPQIPFSNIITIPLKSGK